jgi:arylsulfatase
MTAEIESLGAETLGVVCAIGDWFGGYALFVIDGVAHFTFARAADALALRDNTAMAAGRRTIAVTYRFDHDGGPGQMELSIDGRRADTVTVEGMLPLALQHGGAGLRLGFDSGFPVSPLYQPPAVFSGTVHFVNIEALGLTGLTGPTLTARPEHPPPRSARRYSKSPPGLCRRRPAAPTP